jgi:cytochrome c-type biogenesis protein CcmE
VPRKIISIIMLRIILLFVTGAILSSCNQSGQKESSVPASEMKKVVSATVEELLAEPSGYNGKEVAVSGMVTHVCRHGGQKCFVLGEDGETQIRIVTGGDIDEFKIDLEGSTVAFRGVFRVLLPVEAEALVADHDSKEHHVQEMAHTEAEKADVYIEAVDFKEITR